MANEVDPKASDRRGHPVLGHGRPPPERLRQQTLAHEDDQVGAVGGARRVDARVKDQVGFGQRRVAAQKVDVHGRRVEVLGHQAGSYVSGSVVHGVRVHLYTPQKKNSFI